MPKCPKKKRRRMRKKKTVRITRATEPLSEYDSESGSVARIMRTVFFFRSRLRVFFGHFGIMIPMWGRGGRRNIQSVRIQCGGAGVATAT